MAARGLAEAVLAGDDAAPAEVAVAERALGLAFRHLRQPEASSEHFRRAVAAAAAAGLTELRGLAQMSLCGNLAEAGRFDEALALADEAAGALDGLYEARARVQKATIHVVRGDWHQAAAGYDAALPGVKAAGDLLGVANILANRGLVHLRLGELRRSERDLEEARSLFERLGTHRRVIDVLQNLGLCAVARGDLPAALATFDEIDRRLDAIGVVDPLGLLDRAAALLASRLIEEAAAAADAALAGLTAEGLEARLVTAHLVSADVSLVAGEPAAAAQHAAAAGELLAAQGLEAMRSHADYAGLRARVALDPAQEGLPGMARATAADLDAAGLRVEATDARLLAARLAAAGGDRKGARADLDATAWARRRGPAWLQMAAWHSAALVRLADGDVAGAKAALWAGLRRFDRHQLTLGASDLRARATSLGQGLAATGLRLAIDGGRPTVVFRWAERLRANSLELRPVRPPNERRVGEALGELRVVSARLVAAGGQDADLRRWEARRQRLESEIAALLRHAPSTGQPTVAQTDLAQLRGRLDGSVLVEFAESDGRLYAVVVTRSRSHLVRLCAVDELAPAVEQARFAMARVARSSASAASRSAATALLEHAVAKLDRALFHPLGRRVGGRPVVVVPTGPLHLVPWGALPSRAGQSTTITPSAGLWVRTPQQLSGDGVVLAAGPGLRHAGAEVRAVAELYPDATRLTGRQASAEALLGAMDGARLVHLAAHGRFRSDRPSFSALRMAGGTLHLCDVERLERPPDTVVLSACETALSRSFAGDELMGLAAAFLGMGTSTVVASTLPVSDRHTRTLMVGFHRRLRAGAPPAAALAGARDEFPAGSEQQLVTAGSFQVLGRG